MIALLVSGIFVTLISTGLILWKLTGLTHRLDLVVMDLVNLDKRIREVEQRLLKVEVKLNEN